MSWILGRDATLGSMSMVIALASMISGCSPSPVSPPGPQQNPSAAGPAVTAVIPATGSTAGGSVVTIVGTGFMPGLTVMFGDIRVTPQVADPTSFSTTFRVGAPAHTIGTVDLTVTNPDGQFQRVAAAYTYAPADAFDMNGTWAGFTSNGTDTAVGFEIRDNTLVSATCAFTAAVPFVLSAPPRVQNGAFSVITEDGATLAGSIVSESEIVGTINFPACNAGVLPWRVNRRASEQLR